MVETAYTIWQKRLDADGLTKIIEPSPLQILQFSRLGELAANRAFIGHTFRHAGAEERVSPAFLDISSGVVSTSFFDNAKKHYFHNGGSCYSPEGIIDVLKAWNVVDESQVSESIREAIVAYRGRFVLGINEMYSSALQAFKQANTFELSQP